MRIKISVFLGMVFLPLSLWAATPQNLTGLKKQLREYALSGEYMHAIQRVDIQATRYLKKRIAENKKRDKPKRLAIVMDIDETSLSNLANMLKPSFSGLTSQNDPYVMLAKDPAIKPTLTLYQYAIRQGVAVFFVTGRREYMRKATVKNLRKAGYTTWTKLYMPPDHYKAPKKGTFKSVVFKLIRDKGYDIVFELGDQPGDLVGHDAEKRFKLPNPFYQTG